MADMTDIVVDLNEYYSTNHNGDTTTARMHVTLPGEKQPRLSFLLVGTEPDMRQYAKDATIGIKYRDPVSQTFLKTPQGSESYLTIDGKIEHFSFENQKRYEIGNKLTR